MERRTDVGVGTGKGEKREMGDDGEMRECFVEWLETFLLPFGRGMSLAIDCERCK